MARLLTICLCTLLVTPPLPAWNDAGHRAIAFLAWSHLTPAAKARALQILRAHPDFASILSQNVSVMDAGRQSFIIAATWPDIIRDDPRFEPSAPLLPGFPDMNRHTKWHFINIPVPAEFARQPVDPEDGPVELSRLLAALRKKGPVSVGEAYALPWILHIIGDLHQPLHTVARFSNATGKPVPDRGGNDCFVNAGTRLHSLWDGLLGRQTDEQAIAALAAGLEKEHPMPSKTDRKPRTWVREGVAAAASHVYTFPGPCTEAAPAALPGSYETRARDLARARAALAAYRLAAILNKKLGS
jgi:hypothetical protein